MATQRKAAEPTPTAADVLEAHRAEVHAIARQAAAERMPRQTLAKLLRERYGVTATDARELAADGLGMVADERDARARKLLAEMHTAIAPLARDAAAHNERHTALAPRLVRQAGVPEDVAEIVALEALRRQWSARTKARQTGAGITHYRWCALKDSRTPQSHLDLDGRTFAWMDAPLVDGERVHPGERGAACATRSPCWTMTTAPGARPGSRSRSWT